VIVPPGDSKTGEWFGTWDSGESIHGLVALTDFEKIGPVRYEEFGLIDHIVVSDQLAKHFGTPKFCQRDHNREGTFSDHFGVAVGITTSI
jgi:endonuclease/exonuclease/phosphatase family metal-dependent hydrolase